MKFRKKPVVVEAEQWFPGRGVSGVEYEYVTAEIGGVPGYVQGKRAYVATIHGQRAYLAAGDWVIREPDGVHYYPCRPDVFAATYEPVDETADPKLTAEPRETICPPGGH